MNETFSATARDAGDVVTSFYDFCKIHHVEELVEDACIVDQWPDFTYGEAFVTACGVLLDSLVSMHESGDLADDWPEADRVIAAVLAVAHE